MQEVTNVFYLGFSTGSKAYRLYDPVQKKIVISRDVIFEEESQWEWGRDCGNDQELVIEEETLPVGASPTVVTIEENHEDVQPK